MYTKETNDIINTLPRHRIAEFIFQCYDTISDKLTNNEHLCLTAVKKYIEGPSSTALNDINTVALRAYTDGKSAKNFVDLADFVSDVPSDLYDERARSFSLMTCVVQDCVFRSEGCRWPAFYINILQKIWHETTPLERILWKH